MKTAPVKRAHQAGIAALALLLTGAVSVQSAASPRKPRTPSRTVTASETEESLVKSITRMVEEGGRVDWHSGSGKILMDQQGAGKDVYFDIYMMNEDGSEKECLTCDHPQLPNKSIGNPAFHPSGKFMAFQAQNSYRGLGFITDWFANPGAGVNNDIYIMNLETREVSQITDLPIRTAGVLHPSFSPSGKKLTWSERYDKEGHQMGMWRINVADVTLKGDMLEVSDIRKFRPGKQKIFYETHCFTPDEKSVFFSGFLEPNQGANVQDIYRYNFVDDELERLTTTLDHWDEHAQLSPSGKSIIWMTSVDVEKPKISARADYWVMNPDGSNKRRLTYFNKPGHPHYIEGGAIAADFAWSDDGRRIFAYLILSYNPQRSANVMIEFKEPF